MARCIILLQIIRIPTTHRTHIFDGYSDADDDSIEDLATVWQDV